jgi:hypothetical protein
MKWIERYYVRQALRSRQESSLDGCIAFVFVVVFVALFVWLYTL